MRTKNLGRLVTALLAAGLLAASAAAAEPGHPPIAAGVPFFYYSDLQEAEDWYENKLGLKKITDEDWVVIFELTPGSHIGLVNASGGSLRPAADKGALLSIETPALEAWWRRLSNMDGVDMIHGIESGADGMIEEFRMYDPGGYIVEFFRWQGGRPEAEKYGAATTVTGEPGRRRISSGAKWEELAAYSRAVVDGDWVFVSGTVGFDPKDSSLPADFDLQMDNIFRNIKDALSEADAELADIVRVRCFLVDQQYVQAMSRKLRQYLAAVRPTNTTVITELAAEGALVEIEVTALRRGPE